jgi:natural product biosynthesis luciferase-like monooxygenase protein
MKFGIMFFSSFLEEKCGSPYSLLLEAAKLADREEFTAIWTPERHFHRFGGGFSNPAMTSAALAMVTNRIQLRAGSLISPLHHEIRIAEDWAIIDNLSGGRAAISFGSGWNANDFVFAPERYQDRREIMYRQITAIQQLWRGDTLSVPNPFGKTVEVALFPQPVNRNLPIWITSSGDIATFRRAGAIGANLLTHLVGQDLAQLRDKIREYRMAREEHGFPAMGGIVSLMVHTYLDETKPLAETKARPALRNYLQSALELEQRAAAGGGTVSGGRKAHSEAASPALAAEMLEISVDRYLSGNSIIGTVETAVQVITAFEMAGVDEIACLIDFGLSQEDVLGSIGRIAKLARMARTRDYL